MRKLVPLVALLTILTAHAQLTNPGFEQTTTAPLPPGWVAKGDLRPAAWTYNVQQLGTVGLVEDAHSGKCALFLAPVNNLAHVLQGSIPVQTGDRFEYSGWAKSGRVSLTFYEYAGSKWLRTTPDVATLTAGDQWSDGGGYYTVTDPTVTAIVPVISVNYATGVLVDDLNLRKLEAPAQAAGPDIILENPTLKLVLNARGECQSLFDKVRNEERNLAPGRPFMQAVSGNWALPVSALTVNKDLLTVTFGENKASATIQVQVQPQFITFLLRSWQPQTVDAITLADLIVTKQDMVAGQIGATHDANSALGLQSLHFSGLRRATAVGADRVNLFVNYNRLVRDRDALYPKPKYLGCSLFACSRSQFVPTVQAIEAAYDLPSPKLDGVWGKLSPAMHKSYFFVTDLTEANVDEVIAYGKQGHFSYVLIVEHAWSKAGGGTFEINPTGFPNGLKGLKATISKIQKAGFKVGLHLLTAGMSPRDPLVTPVPDKGIYSDTQVPLASDVDEKATFIPTTAPPKAFPAEELPYYGHGTTLWIGDEIIRYGKLKLDPPYGFENCTRGLWGTKPAAHKAADPVKHLYMAYGLVLIDADSDLIERVSQRIADVMNYCNCDGIYFDGSELLQGDHSYYNARLHMAYLDKIKKKDLIVQGSSYSPYSWHAISRTASADGFRKIKLYLDKRSPSFPWYFSNLMPLDIGWYGINNNIRPDDIEYVCSRAVGFDSSISIETSTNSLRTVPQASEMIDIVGAWEALRLSGRVPAALREQMRTPGKEFRLMQVKGEDVMVPVQYSPWAMNPPLDAPEQTEKDETDALRPWDDINSELNIKNDRGTAAQVELHLECGEGMRPGPDYAAGQPLELFESAPAGDAKPLDTNQYDPATHGSRATSQGVTQELTLVTDDVKEGKTALRFSATSTLSEKVGWATFGKTFPTPLDLSNYGVIALWVKGDGKGEALKVQLWDTAGNPQDQYIPINFKGWRFIELPRPTGLAIDHSKINRLNFYYNGMPGNTTSITILDGVKVLPKGTVMQRPTLIVNGKTITFPVSMAIGDRIVYRGPSDCWQYMRGTQEKRRVIPEGNVGALTGDLTLSAQEASHQLRYRAALLWPTLGTVLPRK